MNTEAEQAAEYDDEPCAHVWLDMPESDAHHCIDCGVTNLGPPA